MFNVKGYIKNSNTSNKKIYVDGKLIEGSFVPFSDKNEVNIVIEL